MARSARAIGYNGNASAAAVASLLRNAQTGEASAFTDPHVSSTAHRKPRDAPQPRPV